MRGEATGGAAWLVVSLLSIQTFAGTVNDAARLAEAVKRQDAKAVKALLKQGADVNAPQPHGTTVLHWATQSGDATTVDLLLDAGAGVDATDDYGVTPLWLACLNGHPRLVDQLLKAGANPKATLPTGETMLMRAAHSGNAAVVKLLVEHRADVNAKETLLGQTALMWAASEGHADAVQELITKGADIHARSKAGFTPFLLSARSAGLDAAKALLDAGADVNEASPDGTTALIVALLRGNTALAKFLLDKGADANAGPGFAPLHWVAGEWRDSLNGDRRDENSAWRAFEGLEGPAKLELTKALLAHGADPNARTKRTPSYGRNVGGRGGDTRGGATPFFIASSVADLDLMRLLVDTGADPTLATDRHTTPLMAAAGVGSGISGSPVPQAQALEAVKLCLELGNDINAANVEGETALHGAAYRGPQGTEMLLQFLLDKGARINAKNKHGWTALTIVEGLYTNASNTRSPSGIAVLRKFGAEPTPTGFDGNLGSSVLNGALNR